MELGGNLKKSSLKGLHASFSEEIEELGIPRHVYPYTAGIVGGLLGGAAMVFPALLYGLLSGHGPWYAANLVAATVLPPLQGQGPGSFESFNLLYLGVGLTIHIIVATMLGLTFAILLPTLPGRPQLWALIVGPLLWLAATSIVLPTINPVMSRLLDWPSFAIANLVYGVVMGLWVARTPRVRAN